MRPAALALIALIAALHLYIAWFEIFRLDHPRPGVFDMFPPELFEPTIQLAANQGVYNGFLAIGLIWALFIRDTVWQTKVAVCFLSFVAFAGITAALTIAVTSGLPQLVPAVVALGLLLASRRSA